MAILREQIARVGRSGSSTHVWRSSSSSSRHTPWYLLIACGVDGSSTITVRGGACVKPASKHAQARAHVKKGGYRQRGGTRVACSGAHLAKLSQEVAQRASCTPAQREGLGQLRGAQWGRSGIVWRQCHADDMLPPVLIGPA